MANISNRMVQDPTALTNAAVAQARTEIEKLFDTKLSGFQNLVEEKFVGVKTEFTMRDIALSAAFKAAEAAVSQQNASNTVAIDKSGEGFTKQIDSLDEKIDDLKTRLGSLEGRGAGHGDVWGYVIGAAGVVIAVVAVIALVLKHN